MTFKKLAVIALLGAAAFNSPAMAKDPIPAISLVTVVTRDVVEATKGSEVDGKTEWAAVSRELSGETVVRRFVSAENCGDYMANPTNFPDVGKKVRLAFFGVDPVERMPDGIHAAKEGPVVDGVKEFTYTHHTPSGQSAVFTFSTKSNLAKFTLDPSKYITAVGGYCLGAMSRGNVVAGDPRNMLFIREAPGGGVWATFGSLKGRDNVGKMGAADRLVLYNQAVANYQRLTGQFAQVASLPR